MASVTSNLDSIIAGIMGLADAIDMTRDGLGADCLDEAVGGIVERNAAQTGPDGEWDANAPAYAARKGGLPVGVGIKRAGSSDSGGLMLSLQEIRGEREIKADHASMTYGTTEFQRRKLQWFTNGSTVGADGGEPSGARNQPPRPVYAVNDADVERIMGVIGDHVERYLNSI